MRILIIHQYFLIPGQPGGSRFNEMGRFWTEAGHQVSVIAGTVNHATGASLTARERWLEHRQEGIFDVWRCHVPSTYSKSYAGRMWAFLGFTLSSATAALRCARADVVIATSPPLITAIPGWIAAKLRSPRAKFIFEMRDLWPESAVTTGVLKPDSLLTKALFKLERWACRRADLVNVLTPAFREDIVRRGLVTEDKVIFVPNGADLDTFKPGPRDNAARRELAWGDKLVFLYAGAHSRANALGQLVEAARLTADRPDLHIALAGDGPDRTALEDTVRRLGLNNIQFCGPQPKERMAELVNAADVGVAVLQDNPTFRTVYPNKVFDYMACERPVLLGIDGVARRLVCDDAKAGVFVQPEDAPALVHAMKRFAETPRERREMGVNGRAWVEANAGREALAGRYLTHLKELVQTQ